MVTDSCIFCRIAGGAASADILYEDDRVFAIRDISPQAPSHFLIIPRKHVPTLLDLENVDEGLGDHILRTAALLAERHGFADAGFRLVANCNSDGGQTVWHLHFHLLAGRQLHWPPG